MRGELVAELRTLFGLWVEQAIESECLVSWIYCYILTDIVFCKGDGP
jgi:hypothetical protein